MKQRLFNVSMKRRGGIRFFKIGRINLSFSVSRPKLDAVDANALRHARLAAELERDIALMVAHNIAMTVQ